MFKHSSSTLSLYIALLLVFSITLQGFARATGMIVSAKTTNIEKSASTDVQKESGTGVSPVNHAQDARATRPLTKLANRNALTPMFAPVITATLTDNITLATKVVPGGTINYTAVISNTTTDATGVTYTDTLDSHTTLVPGSLKVSPLAFADTYNTIGNVDISVPSGSGVLANDTNPGGAGSLTVTLVNGSATGAPVATTHGSVTMQSDGSFTYNPTAGFSGPSDSFTYTLGNGSGLTDTGTATINISGLIWFVNNSPGSNGDGRLSSPFRTLVGGANPLTGTVANDAIFLYTGSGNYTGGLTLTSGEKVIGQGASQSILTITGFTTPSGTNLLPSTGGSNPTITAASANEITLGSNNQIWGTTFGSTTGTSLTGSAYGTLKVRDTTISNGSGRALNLSNGTADVILQSLSSTGASGVTGMTIDTTAGSFQVTGTTSVTNSGAAAVNLTTNTGTITFATLNITNTTSNQTGLNATENTNTITTTSGTINTGTANAITISRSSSTTPLAIVLTSVTSGGGTNGVNLLNISGSLSVTGDGASDPANTTRGRTTAKNGGGTITLGSGGTIQSATGAGVKLNNVSNITLQNMTIQNNGSGINTGGDGINATNVSGLTLDNVLITGQSGNSGLRGNSTASAPSINNLNMQHADIHNNGTTSGTETNDNWNVRLDDVTGTESWQNSLFTTSRENIVGLKQGINKTNANLTLTITNCQFSDTTTFASPANDGFSLSAFNSAVSNVTATGSTFQNVEVGGFQYTGNDNSSGTINVRNNNTTTTPTGGFENTGSDILISHGGGSGGNSTLNFDVSGNTERQLTGNPASTVAINVFLGGLSGASSLMTGKIENNTIGNAGVSGSGSHIGDGIDVNATGAGTITATVSGNTTHQIHQGDCFFAEANSGSAKLNVFMHSNSFNTDSGSGIALTGAHLVGGAQSSDTAQICVDMAANTLHGDNNYTGLEIDTFSTSSAAMKLVGMSTTFNDNASAIGNFAGSNAMTTPPGVNTSVTPVPFAAAIGAGSHIIGATTCSVTFPPIAPPADGNGTNTVQNEVSNTSPTNDGGTSASTFAWLKQVIHPVAVFAAELNFLNSSTPAVTPIAIAAERSPATLEVKSARASSTRQQKGVTPQSGETVTVNNGGSGFTLPVGKSITITYQATVNSPPLVRSVNTQGTVSGSNFSNVPTTDPETGTAVATVTNIDTTITWTGATSTDWNDATNWQLTGPVVSTYAPGVTNPAVNDVVIPNVGAQPNIGTTDIGIFSLNLSNGRTLTIGGARTLTIGGAPGGNLTLDGIISGGSLNMGTGTHTISNAGGTGSITPTNTTTVLSGGNVTLNNNLQADSLTINSGGTLNITSRTLSLTGSLNNGGTLTLTGSTVIFDGTGAQTLTNTTAFNALTINNTGGSVTLGSNATVNGTLTLTSDLTTTNSFTLTMPLAGIISGGADVVGNFTRTNGGPQFPSATNITFGNPNTLLNFTAAGTRPTSINFKLTKTVPTDAATGGTNTGFPGAVARTYVITPTGGSGYSATMQLHYLTSELNGNSEANPGPGLTVSLRLYKYVVNGPGTGWQQQDINNNFANTTVDTTSPGNHFVKLGALGFNGFSPWTIGGVSPTAATSTVNGRIVDDSGNPVEGAVILLSGTQNRKTITDSQGNYNFFEVETNGFYTVTPSRVNYNFSPSTRGFSALGAHTEASFAATYNGGHQNPIDTTEYFVRQQYVDFLGREPEEKGFNDWTDTINNCAPNDTSCDRVHVSEMFFRSAEFQQRGYYIYRFYPAAFGRKPDYAEFTPDFARVSGFLTDDQLEAAKAQFANDFASRPAFVNLYGALGNAQYIDALSQAAGVTLSNRQALIDSLNAGTITRPQALRQIAESGEVNAKYYNQAFVVMEYFGYLRRDPDILYLNWIDVLNQSGDARHMVEGFVDSIEYRNRFKQ